MPIRCISTPVAIWSQLQAQLSRALELTQSPRGSTPLCPTGQSLSFGSPLVLRVAAMAPKGRPPAQFFLDLPFDVVVLPRFITLQMADEILEVECPTSWEDGFVMYRAPTVAMVWELFVANLPELRRAPADTSHLFIVRQPPRDTVSMSDEVRWNIRVRCLGAGDFVETPYASLHGFIPPLAAGKGAGKGKGKGKGKGSGTAKGAGKGPY